MMIMPDKVVFMDSYKIEKQYQQYGSVCINTSLDTTYKVKKRDISKEMTKAYLKLLSNNRMSGE
jgi:hypothetical protein